MRKIFFGLLFLASSAFAQTFPVNNLQINGSVSGNVTGLGNVVLQTSPTITSGTLSNPTVTGSFNAPGLVTVSDLANPSTTVNGTVCTLGASCTVSSTPSIPNASANTNSTTGSISGGSTSLTLGSSNGFANGQGIMVIGAGPVNTIAAPTSGSVTNGGVSGGTVYQYAIVSIDAHGGLSGPLNTQTNTGNATLSCTGAANNYNQINWTAPGGSPSGYAVYKNIGGQYHIIGTTPGTSFFDCNSSSISGQPAWLPQLSPGSPTNDWLLTTVVGGGGTTSLTLANSATNSVSGAVVLHDDTAAIQAAINALPSAGGVVDLGISTYPISSSLGIGNGTSSALSTKRGVVLKGDIPPISGIFWNYPNTPGARLFFQGTPVAVISVNGPLQGWGVDNLFIDCNDVAQFGLVVTSAQFGDSNNLYLNECVYGLFSTTVPVISGNNTDSLHNSYKNVTINPPLNGFSVGLTISGTPNSDTDYNHFENFMWGNPERNYATGINAGQSDSNVFINSQVSGVVGVINFQYSGSQGPSANIFFGIDPGSSSQSVNFVFNSGTPSGPAPNFFYGTLGANGGTCPSIANLTCK